MRKSTIIPALVFTAIALGGCSAPAEAPPQPTITVTAEPEAPASPTRSYEEQAFIDAVEYQFGSITEQEATDIVDLGWNICLALSESMTIDDLLFALTDGTGFTVDDAGFLIGASVGALCPEFLPVIDEYISINA